MDLDWFRDNALTCTHLIRFVAVASLFKSKPMLRRVALATITMFFQQWTGEADFADAA